jgi:GLPGLI family protein
MQKLLLFLFVCYFVSVIEGQTVKGVRVVYALHIETGLLTNDTAARREPQGQPIVLKTYLYTDGSTAVYGSGVDAQAMLDLDPMQRGVMYKKGKQGFKYEAIDAGCCKVYRQLKGRFRLEKTKITERIAGIECRKVLVRDGQTGEQFALWYAPGIKGSFSPLGIYPVKGLVLKVVNDKLHVEAEEVKDLILPAELLLRPFALEVGEEELRKGFIP